MNWPQEPSGLREKIVDLVMEVKFIINIHALVFNNNNNNNNILLIIIYYYYYY
jgi:hypothetical protein